MPKATDAAAGDAAVLAEQLASNAVDVLPPGALAEKLETAMAQGRPLRVKLGIDPTAPDIHVGHAVVLRKLRQFQDAGQKVVLIIGDYTARVGDPSGRSSERPLLSVEQIEANAKTFQEQALRILDTGSERLEVRHNSEWLDMDMAEMLRLARTTTVAQLVERDDFAKRLAAKQPVSMLELLYPLLQGYDSVAVQADVELGGTDQKFNLLLGREVQRAYGQPAQAILTMPLLVGIDGRRKMSKSLHNEIGITDPPEEMFGKTMRIPDEAMAEYERLLLEPLDATPAFTQQREGAADPDEAPPHSTDARDRKRALARGLVGWLHSKQAAQAAERQFERVHVQHEAPESVQDALISAASQTVHLPEVIAAEFGVSRSEARRLIDQGGATLGEQALTRGEYDVPLARADGQLLKVGRRRFRRLRAY